MSTKHDGALAAEAERLQHTSSRGTSPPLIVARIGGEAHLVAARAFADGAVVIELEGEVRSTPDRYSVQLGPGKHLYPPAGSADDDDRYLWRFLNHSCAPNASFEGHRLIALQAIRAGEEITFDYNTTEAEIAQPFCCRCGHCGGRTIRGFRSRSAE